MVRRLLLIGLSLVPNLALADAVPAPPADCPPGSQGETGHGGTRCEATTCQNDADCEDGRLCRDAALCVREISATFNTYTQRPAQATFAVAIGACPEGPTQCAPDSPAHIGFRSGGRDVTSANADDFLRPAGPASCVTARRCLRPDEVASPRAAAEASAPVPEPSGQAPTGPSPTTPRADTAEPSGGGCSIGARGGPSRPSGVALFGLIALGVCRLSFRAPGSRHRPR